VALSPERPDLGFQGTIEHAVRTYAQLAMRRTYLGRRDRLGREDDGARCGGAARRRSSGELPRMTRRTGTTTSGSGGLLTSLRVSEAAP
jgi:hypothetical protein